MTIKQFRPLVRKALGQYSDYEYGSLIRRISDKEEVVIKIGNHYKEKNGDRFSLMIYFYSREKKGENFVWYSSPLILGGINSDILSIIRKAKDALQETKNLNSLCKALMKLPKSVRDKFTQINF